MAYFHFALYFVVAFSKKLNKTNNKDIILANSWLNLQNRTAGNAPQFDLLVS